MHGDVMAATPTGQAHPARVRRDIRHLRPKATRPAGAPKFSRPGPARQPTWTSTGSEEHKTGSAIATVPSGLTVATLLGVPLGSLLGHTAGWRAPSRCCPR